MIIKILSRSVLFCIVVCVALSLSNAQGQDFDKNENDVLLSSVQFSGESLEEASTQISSQTGYQIVIKKEWAQLPVFGSFDGVTIEQFFQRVLRDHNLSLISSVEKKVVVVRLFGDKNLDNLLSISAKSGSTAKSDANVVDVDIMDGQKLSEIKELYSQYEAEMERWKNDPDAEDPLDGQKLSEARELQAEYEAGMEKWKNDPEAVDPLDGQKLSEVRRIQAEYDKEMERWRNDPEAVDSLDGQKISEIRKLRASYEAEMERWKNDPEATDPLDGQKLSEIRRLQAEYEANK
ncbi:MAG: hypothetical protein K9K37_12835 [Desulfocapsa sp.]|nr:hypothetical protein [Desulfocapsa sp.]